MDMVNNMINRTEHGFEFGLSVSERSEKRENIEQKGVEYKREKEYKGKEYNEFVRPGTLKYGKEHEVRTKTQENGRNSGLKLKMGTR